MDIGSLVQQQGDHVRVALLRGQVEWCYALLCHNVGLGSIAEERGSDLHLVLLGSNV